MIRVPAERLPTHPAARQAALEDYFAFDLWPRWTDDGDEVVIELIPPPAAAFYVDERLDEGLATWDPPVRLTDIPTAWGEIDECFVSLNDAWTLYSWSRWLRRRLDAHDEPTEVVVLHADDHEDLMSPRVISVDARMVDAITGREVRLDAPDTVAAAIESGGIGMGSFVVPFLHRFPALEMRHLKANADHTGSTPLMPTTQPDSLLHPGEPRLDSVRLPSGGGSGRYSRTGDVATWAAPTGGRPALLHVDLDYFNNRFDGDSDWPLHERQHDPPLDEVLRMVDELFDALEASGAIENIEDVAIGVSPAFFPAEMWEPTVGRIISRLAPSRPAIRHRP